MPCNSGKKRQPHDIVGSVLDYLNAFMGPTITKSLHRLFDAVSTSCTKDDDGVSWVLKVSASTKDIPSSSLSHVCQMGKETHGSSWFLTN